MSILHLTFQEYFAGRALSRLSPSERWERIRPHLHDPRWREPIRLCAGRLAIRECSEEAGALVRAILRFPDPDEPYLLRNLLLALLVAGDDVGLDGSLLEELVARAVAALPTRVHALGRALLQGLGRLVENGATPVDRCFVPALDAPDPGMRRVAVEVLGRLRGCEAARPLLLDRLEDEEDRVVDATLIALTGRIDHDPEIRALLLVRIDDPQAHRRWSAIEALAGAAAGDVEVREALIRKLQAEDSIERREAVRSLAGLVVREVTVRNAVLALAQDEDSWVRGEVLEALAPLAETDVQVREALRAGLDDPESWVRSAAVEGLAGVEQTRTDLLARMEDDSEGVREAAVTALDPQAATDISVRMALEQRLEDREDDDSVRGASLRALAALLPDARLSEIVAGWAESVSWRLRDDAASFAGENAQRIPAVSLLRHVLGDARAPEADFAIAATLVPLTTLLPEEPRIRTRSLELLNHSDRRVRLRAVQALIPRVESDAAIREVFLARLQDEDYQVQRAVARALGRLLEQDGELRELLRRWFNDQEYPFDLPRLPPEATSAEIREAIEGLGRRFGSEPRSPDGDIAQVRASTRLRSELLRRFQARQNLMRERVARIFAHCLDDEAVKEAVLDALERDDFRIRLALVDELCRSHPDRLEEEIEEPLRGWLLADAKSDFRSFHDFDEDRLEEVRRRIAGRLGSRLPEDAELREWLMEQLGNARWSARLGAALALLAWPQGPPPEITERVLATTEDRRGLESYPARLTAARFLAQDGELAATAIDLALEALGYGIHPWEHLSGSAWVRRQAVGILSRMQRYSDLRTRAHEALLRSLQEDPEPEVRDAAFEALSPST